MQDYRKLAVWQNSHALTLAVYKATKSFPRDEMFGLTSQVRRAASSMGANIAEGCGRSTNKERAHYLHNAGGPANEVENHLLLARDIEYQDASMFDEFARQVSEVRRMLVALESRVLRGLDD